LTETTIDIDKKRSELISVYCVFKGIKKKDFIKEVIDNNKDLQKFKEDLKILRFR
jgi:hypothetical protein